MRRFNYTWLIGALVLGTFYFLNPLEAPAEEPPLVRISGTRYVYFAITDAAKQYCEKHPDARITVSQTESESGLRRLIEGQDDAFMTFRKLDKDEIAEAEEKGKKIVERSIGNGAVAIIANPQNPIQELTLEQVRKIFLGEYQNWKELGGLDLPIVTMTREESMSGTEQMFRELALEGSVVAQKTIRVCDHDIVRAFLGKPGAIADARYSEAIRGKTRGMVKIIPIKADGQSAAVYPTDETVNSGTYPITGPLYLYHEEKSRIPHLKSFVDYCSLKGMGTAVSQMR